VVEGASVSRPGASFLAAAALIAAAYLVLHALGGREATAVLSGTGHLDGDPLLGASYAVASLALRVLAPILALASVIRLGLERAWPSAPPPSPARAATPPGRA
jgi:hypothetical protein